MTGTKLFSSGIESAMFYIKLQHPVYIIQKTSIIERGLSSNYISKFTKEEKVTIKQISDIAKLH